MKSPLCYIHVLYLNMKLETLGFFVVFDLLHRLSYKVRREQVVGNEDVNGTAMNM